MSTATQGTGIYTRVALVTEASRGIGRAIALRLAADGLDVAVNDLPDKVVPLNALVDDIQRLGRQAIAVTGDVSQKEEVKAMVVSTVSVLGRLDVMVANAGVGGTIVPVIDGDVEKWEECWKVNIRGVLLCYKYAARQMIKQGAGGRIIGASSICGLRGYAHFGGYCVSKAAVRSLTQKTALELKKYSITVNAYAPGAVDTEMAVNEVDKEHGPGFALKRLLRISESDVRTGQPADVAAVASFLASPDSHFVTGQTISVDDGASFSSINDRRARHRL
ncbi:hypothetical protein DFH06DRAFT_1060094 [Mycena polygramma]|nr:hypothetical protein DFH06DRAFT_1060094 [Mycena polygramma]